MWCFLGKIVKRKSLKPDLVRKAVTKRSPTKTSSNPSTTPTSILRNAPSPLLQLNEHSQPELANQLDLTAHQKEVAEDALKARKVPSGKMLKRRWRI